VVKVASRPDCAEALLDAASKRQRESFVSGGTAVASVKELTLCTIKAWVAWQLKQKGERLQEEEPDEVGKIKIGMGVALGLYLNPDPELRWEIPTVYGPVSGRTDLMDLDDEGNLIPAELKVTWSKEVYGPSAQYVEQLGGYCIAQAFKEDGAITRDMRGRLYIAYVAGDWGFRIKPKFWCGEYWFGKEELQAYYTEEIVRKTKAKLGPARPSFADHFKWECANCVVNLVNGGDCPAEDGKDRGGFFIVEE
jgi:hypothetical protein